MASIIHVIKRDGTTEEVLITKIENRLLKLCNETQKKIIDITAVSEKVNRGLYPGVKTYEIDILASEICASMVIKHIEYQKLAGKIAISKLHKETNPRFSEVISQSYNYINPITNVKSPLITEAVFHIVMKHCDILDEAIDENRDYDIGYFGLETLKATHLIKIDGKVIERPQHMFMRTAIAIHRHEIREAIETYRLMSGKWFIHSTSTLANSGTSSSQLSSCYLVSLKSDSLEGVFDTLHQCAVISKHSGGIGLNVHSLRSTGAYISGTNSLSKGLVPVLQIFNGMIRFVDHGAKRPSAMVVYLEPWHSDLIEFLAMRSNHGDESSKARDIFTGLWIPDLFMKRVEADADWTLMDPARCPGLSDCWGEEFDRLYESYERRQLGVNTVKAFSLWIKILESQIETGTPFLLYKDACNRKSNQKHLGTIKCSNLCTEIIQYSSPDEIAVCNVASICLPMFVNCATKSFDYDKLIEIAAVLTNNLNKIIDVTVYPFEEAARSNKRHRPIGIGVQGLADVFALMRYPYDSAEAAAMNRRIFETIYYGALMQSCQLAKEFGVYASYQGSPMSASILQPDLWGVKCSDDLDWNQLRMDIKLHGVRNSLLVAAMPTASTSQIFGFNECFEPFHNNIYSRRVHSGDFVVVNQYLVDDLEWRGLLTDEIRNALLVNWGSIQNINGIPDDLKALYKTVWEISPGIIIKMAAERAPFIDQSQSMNLFIGSPDCQQLTAFHFMSWKKGLKTGMYYLRRKPVAHPIQFTVDKPKRS